MYFKGGGFPTGFPTGLDEGYERKGGVNLLRWGWRTIRGLIFGI